MKVLIKNYHETESNISMEFRMEQEPKHHGYTNSVGYFPIVFKKSDYPQLSRKEDFETLAYRKNKDAAIEVFKKGQGYKEEPVIFQEIEVIENANDVSEVKETFHIKLTGSATLTKYKGEDLVITNSATLYNQFNEALETVDIIYNQEDISDEMTELKVSAEIQGVTQEFTIAVNVTERQLTENEKLQQQLFIARTDAMRNKQEVNELKELLVSKGVIDSE